MANEQQLAILKQGVQVWNKWREENPGVEIDLSGADLNGIDLTQIDLIFANLRGANLNRTRLVGANLSGADLILANLYGADLGVADLHQTMLGSANLSNAYLGVADLRGADLSGTDLTRASLVDADLRGAYLGEADFSEADLHLANLSRVRLSETKFSSARIRSTIFGNVDLGGAAGLENAEHSGPSTIGTDTLVLSKGKIPEAFLQGCGLSDWEIELAKLYNPDLSNEERNKVWYRVFNLQAGQALQISPLFISYSHADSEFVDKIGHSLTKKGIRYWRDVKDLKAGRVEKQLDQAIHQNPTLLLILSQNSLSSDWVEHEARAARKLEKDMERDVLCPVALDDSWKSNRWPKRIMEQIMEYNILDFSEWQDDSKFDAMFRKLIDGLNLFYK